jgi:hypothetical protein
MERRARYDRWFKRLIVLATCVVLAIMLSVMPRGRYAVGSIPPWARRAARQAVGMPTPRSEIDEEWRRYRQQCIDETRPRVERLYAESSRYDQRLLRYAGMDPEHALLRWGNFHSTLCFSSKLLEADDEGRSYRFKPMTRSIWLINIPFNTSVWMCYLVPDGPGLADALRGTLATPLETSRQTTNSWGLRGPEPDLDAPVRGIILGDSFMQGAFISDDETPPEYLRRYLAKNLKTRVSILNTGVMGYSPEQYYYSLIAFGHRFRPQFVVVSVFANDFGPGNEVVSRGAGDWEEGKYWLEKIGTYCRERHWPCLIVPVPYSGSVLNARKSGYYPGILSNNLDIPSMMYLFPIEDFVNAHLRLLKENKRAGRELSGCPLYNDTIRDGHLSAAGSEVWADSVGRRIVLLLE